MMPAQYNNSELRGTFIDDATRPAQLTWSARSRTCGAIEAAIRPLPADHRAPFKNQRTRDLPVLTEPHRGQCLNQRRICGARKSGLSINEAVTVA
jgi:hypothetical protein